MSNTVERHSQTWWAVMDDHSVDVVTGYACSNPRMWWCPSIGYTLTEGYHLFKDKESAKARAIQEIEERIAILEKKLRELKYLC